MCIRDRAVPALRKGQWTTDGCKATGKDGIAFKRATKDCYALVALNGGATFTAVSYTHLIAIRAVPIRMLPSRNTAMVLHR